MNTLVWTPCLLHASDTSVLVVIDCVCLISTALLVLMATTHWGQEIHVLFALQAAAVRQPAVHLSLVPRGHIAMKEMSIVPSVQLGITAL